MSTGTMLPGGIWESQLGQPPMQSFIFNQQSPTVAPGFELGYWHGGGTGGTNGINGQVSMLNNAGNAAVGSAKSAQNSATATANQLKSLGSAMSGEFSYNDAYAQQALADAFDPHKDIYNRYLGQVTDQTNSQSALRGIANTPYGAAVTADSLGNFNTAWNAQQIQNENVGMQTATGLQQQRLSAQEAGGALINDAGQLNLGAAKNLLEAYGIQGSDMSAALSALTNMFGIQTQANTAAMQAQYGLAGHAMSGGGGMGQTPNQAASNAFPSFSTGY